MTSKSLKIIACVFPTVLTLVYFVFLRDHSVGLQKAIYALGKLIQFGIIPFFWWKTRGKTFQNLFRTNTKALLNGLLSGLILSFFILGFVKGVLQTLPDWEFIVQNIQVRLKQLGVHSESEIFGMAVFYSLIHSGFEEFYWRWGVDRSLRSILSSFSFAAHHFVLLSVFVGWTNPIAYLGTFAVAIGGMYWAHLDRKYQSILPGWISHACVDAALFWLAWEAFIHKF